MIEVSEIKDSGERREFESGAVRDIAEGKGRCDLLPLDIIAQYYEHQGGAKNRVYADILDKIDCYIREGHKIYILSALKDFIGCFVAEEIEADPTEQMWLDLSKHFEQGAKKYAERNWEKGIPTHCFIDSAVRHFLKYIGGMEDEPHDRAFVWNLVCLLWTVENKPECNDLPFAKKKEGEQ